ncbi:hypothetical protein [Flindersiella endophytica]
MLETLRTPFLCAFSDEGFDIAGGATPFRERIPGARSQPNITIENAGHFLQEGQATEFAEVVNSFVRASH